jgi:ppGpp synthetase/RelA/SpoT-type nucleotidyltranferase
MEKNLQVFLVKYNKTEEEFKKTGLVWEELLAIAEDYQHSVRDLEPVAKYFVDRILELKPQVHSVWYRLKDVEHLIEKIIRKKLHNPKREITIDNYKMEITDLIGIRILHLFKEDWVLINEFIQSHWETIGVPIAFVREGDDEHYLKIFQEKGCKISKEKPYRSVHYLVKSQPSKEPYIAEIQMRTLFEEGWSAIDHEMIYPVNRNEMLQRYLSILNRLAGAADEMGSFVKFLRDELEYKDREVERQKSLVSQLKKEIDLLKKTQPEVAIRIEGKLDTLLEEQDGVVLSSNLFIPIIKSWENLMTEHDKLSDGDKKYIDNLLGNAVEQSHKLLKGVVKKNNKDKNSANKN